ncbi:ParB/RepB/Spo0J family partition protein [Streptomyces sp. NPDC126497]|uniref:ParB/RepB/Spo0J family partition protein n=1 Tax=Streptomyces sp. NPDC126497 TaxID=3155313 RepID=UPI003323C9BD
MAASYLETRDVPLGDLTPFPGNARRGDVGRIAESVERNGQYRSLVVRRTGGALVVLAGNHTLQALQRLGHGQARCEIIECDDATATRINLVDNKSADDGDYDAEALEALLASFDDDLAGTGYDPYDVDSVAADAAGPAWEAGQTQELERAKETLSADPQEAPSGRTLARHVPLDAIFSNSRFFSVTMAGYEMGFQPGVISTALGAAQKILRRMPELRLGFMDNEWHDYNHAKHVKAVAETKPKYATVRDVMTKAQCETAGIEFYPLEQILDMAAEVAEHADHVIVIPKYDCLDKIPDEYVIGFSVPTSYGGTPMPAEALAGRRVHLLGGSWANQRRYLALLGDDVVSLDNNHLGRIAEFGSFYLPSGQVARLPDLHPDMPRTWEAASILSLASMRDDLNATFATRLEPLVGDGAPEPTPQRPEESAA